MYVITSNEKKAFEWRDISNIFNESPPNARLYHFINTFSFATYPIINTPRWYAPGIRDCNRQNGVAKKIAIGKITNG